MKIKHLLIIGLLGIWLSPTLQPVVQAQTNSGTSYELLAPIPLTNPGGAADTKATTSTYLPGLFRLIIALATAVAVVRLIYGGIKYLSTDSFNETNQAKEIIEETLWGLLLVMSSWLIINTINPDLLNFDLKIGGIKSSTQFNSPPSTSSTVQTGQSNLTQEEVKKQFDDAKVVVNGPVNLKGLQQATIDEVVRLKQQCNCAVVVTSATGGKHADGEFDHGSGHKIDLRSQREGVDLTNFITNNYEALPPKKNGDKVYKGPTGAIYVWETNKPSNASPDWAPHWDISVKG
jgi:hypothetical protein